jgi:(1->4)-alpha-D-glucan 1-alpha-D-glucosylmutase
VLAFIDGLMDPERSHGFFEDFLRIQRKIAFHGALNSLSQTVLKITAPGIPDFYQGTELWDFSLADPDNRRPVDYQERASAMVSLQRRSHPERLLKEWKNGRIKMFVAMRTLALRRNSPELFEKGEYIPVPVSGLRKPNVVAFVRRWEKHWLFVAVPRLTMTLVKSGQMPAGTSVWQDTAFELPADAPVAWTNVLTAAAVETPNTAARAFDPLPVALFESRA